MDPEFNTNPFQLGVASSPLKNVIWTRLAPNPHAANGLGGIPAGPGVIYVNWKVARNANKTDIIAEGAVQTNPNLGWSVRHEVPDLPQDSEVFYWFEVGAYSSAVGRLHTAPHPNSNPSQMTAALISCANYEHGYFHSYKHIAEQKVDLIIATGDFTYADSHEPHGSSKVRQHLPAGQCFSLADYRLRHAQYRWDPNEKALRASAGMVCTLDDHEVDDDWAGSTSAWNENAAVNSGPGTFWQRKANALRAYWENMPLPWSMQPNLTLSLMPDSYQTLRWGMLTDIHLLDTRQFRSSQSRDWDSDDNFSDVENQYMLGPAQLAALGNSYRADVRWDLIANQVVMSRWDLYEGVDLDLYSPNNPDAWDGYKAERARVVAQWAQKNVRNPVVLTGDVHCASASQVRLSDDAPVVATEIVTSSITSGGNFLGAWAGTEKGIPRINYLNGLRDDRDDIHMASSRRGYVMLNIHPTHIQVLWRGVHQVTPTQQQSDNTFASARIPDGVKDFTERQSNAPGQPNWWG
jgi:alkaline phosphatase D